jgi:hypothetical protein
MPLFPNLGLTKTGCEIEPQGKTKNRHFITKRKVYFGIHKNNRSTKNECYFKVARFYDKRKKRKKGHTKPKTE